MEFRPLEHGDRTSLGHVARIAFGHDWGIPPEEMFPGVEIDRFFGAIDAGELVGAAGAYTLPMTVPGGGTLEVAGTTVAVVLPTHRRRGILTELMRLHFAESVARGAQAAALWASEAAIYERFGYGRAFDRLEVHIDEPASIRQSAANEGDVRFVEGTEAEKALRSVWDRVRPLRIGASDRSDDWWMWEVFWDPPQAREGKSAFRYAVVDIEGQPAGYVKYRSKLDIPNNFRLRGQLEVIELHAVSDVAETALWRFLIDHDLVIEVHAANLAADSIVSSILEDHRVAHRRLLEGGWFRILDVPGALSSRSYRTDGSLTFSLEDSQVEDNTGTWALTVTEGTPFCVRSEDDPELRLAGPAPLGATYLGSITWREMSAAGLVHGSPAAIAKADQMFTAESSPWFDFF